MTAVRARRKLLAVFDLDGTLVDSVRDLAESANDLVVGLGGRPLEMARVGDMVGEGAALLVQRALAAGGLDPDTPAALPRFLEIYDRRLLNHTKPYPGMREALMRTASRTRLAVLTNKPLRPSRRILERLDLIAFFDEVIGGDGPFPRKPDPTALAVLTKKSGDLPTLMIGDSPIDAKTAAAAGCTFVWARYGFGRARFDEPPDTSYVLDQPSDLADVIDRFEGISQSA